MTSYRTALNAVLWKNCLLIRTQWRWCVAEILVPILFFALVSFGRANYSNVNRNANISTSRSDPVNLKTITSYLTASDNWELWYAPNGDRYHKIIGQVIKNLELDRKRSLNFESKEQLFEDFNNYTDENDIYGISFASINNSLSYNISVGKRYVEWHSSELYRTQAKLTEYDYNPYLHQGFLALQFLINKAFIDMVFEYNEPPNITMSLQEISEYNTNGDNELEQGFFILFLLPLSIIFSICLPIFLSVKKQMTRDQDTGMNDLMKISGVPMVIILLGWFIQRSIMILLALVPIVIFLKGNFWGTPYSPIIYCHWSILFLFILFYTMTAITADLFIACASKNSTVKYVIGMVVWIISYFLPSVIFAYHDKQMSTSYIWIKIILSLFFPNTALHFGCKTLEEHENAETELNFSNMFSSKFSNNGIPMGYLLSILILNVLFTFALSLIIFDIHKVTRKTSNSNKKENADDQGTEMLPKDVGSNGHRSHDTEESSNSHHPFVTIKNLRKKFGVYTALEIPKLELRQGEVTAVLGTNGSGKSTLISIITGITESYSGSVCVVNKAGHTDPQIGYCSQNNVLFDDLTVEENLCFFAKLRTGSVGDAVNHVLEELKLSEQRNAIVRYLSTGLRRKICLAIALVGDPEIIILDEPTDCVVNEELPVIRDVLGKLSNTTIFLTTSNSREAELLAANVLFLHNGRILSQESFSTLRRNDGYYILLVLSDWSLMDEIENYIKDNSQELEVLQRVGKKMVLHCIDDRDKCLAHVRMFEELKIQWKIETISCNLYLLDNLFIKYLNSQEELTETTSQFKQFKERDLPQLSGLFEQRDYGFKTSILIKKWFFFRRKFHWYLPGLLIMFLFASIIVIWTSEGRHNFAYNEPPMELNLNLYNNNEVLFSGINQSLILDSIMKPYGKVNVATVKTDVFSAIVGKMKNGTIKLKGTNIAAVDFTLSHKRNFGMDILYSSRAFHSAPIALDLAMNLILKITKPNDSYTITTNNVPFKEHHTDYIMNELSNAKICLLWAILLPLGLLFLLADYITFPNIEFNTQFLRLQANSWKRLFLYWNLQIVCDICVGALQIIIIIVCVLTLQNIFSSDPVLNSNDFQILFVILLVYVIIQKPSCYVFGSLRRLDQGYTNFVLFGIVSGTVPLIIYISMGPEDGIMTFLAYTLSAFLSQFAVGYNLYKFGRKFTENYNWDHMNPLVRKVVCRKYWTHPCCLPDSAECSKYRSYFSNEEFGIQDSLLISIITFAVWQCLLVIVSSPRLKAWRIQTNNKTATKKTNMVSVETINTNTNGSTGLVIKNGYFPTLNKDMHYIFYPNRLYGVLGSNGAGKSLLLATLTKENLAFEGNIYRTGSTGEKIHIEDEEYIREIGYFPRRHDLLYWLTGSELLTLAGLSRGYSIYKSSTAASKLLAIFDLQLLSNKKCVEYSGGKQRILQICNAFMGFPHFIIINDMARSLDIPIIKTLYDFLLAFKEYTKKTVIVGIARTERFTTLCDCYLLMDGEDTRLPQLQNQSSSFQITLRMKNVPKDERNEDIKHKMNACEEVCKKIFETDDLHRDSRSRFLVISLQSTIFKLSDLIQKVEELKTEHGCIENFSIAEKR